METKIHFSGRGDAWATFDGEGFGVACFAPPGMEPHTIGKLFLSNRGDVVSVHHGDEDVTTKLPKIAALYGVELDEETVANAIAACRFALAERAIAEFKVREAMGDMRARA